jgi:hypothetical protein
LSLSSLLLSPFCFQKPIWGSVRQESSHKGGVEGIYRVNWRAVGTCEASLLHSEDPKPVFW